MLIYDSELDRLKEVTRYLYDEVDWYLVAKPLIQEYLPYLKKMLACEIAKEVCLPTSGRKLRSRALRYTFHCLILN